jgi:hypothetical protein
MVHHLLITDELLYLTVKENNRYVAQQIAIKILLEFSRFHKWKDIHVSSKETRILIATMLLQETGTSLILHK